MEKDGGWGSIFSVNESMMGTSSAGGQTVDVVGGGAQQMEMAERVGRGEEREEETLAR